MALGAYLLIGIILGFIFGLLYVLSAAGTPGIKPELARAVGVFIACNGVIASIRLVVLALTANSLGPLNDNDRLYLIVGAIAALWLSLETIGKVFRDIAAASEAHEQGEEDD